VRIVGVEDSRPAAELVEYQPRHPWVQADAPGGWPHPDTRCLKPPAQLSITTGDHDLIGAESAQLPGQKPHLALPTTPLSPGGDVDDGRRHVPGSMSAGRGPGSRTDR
jgi:hypothetical protein